ncbi:MAG: phosphate ABC transporter permease PstA [Actinobacteria bacterium]|nr:phosphate ABC transporter permease PstA [Actinomycetota bacterium]
MRKGIDVFMTLLLYTAALSSCLVLFVILGFIFTKGVGQVSPAFILGFPRGLNAEGGIFPTIVASFYATAVAMTVVTPIGIGAAIYLSEYATGGRIVRLIRFGADTLASVPSIVFGLFGLALFVNFLHLGWSMLSGGLTLAVMALPIIMRTAEEAILAVPRSYREASFALGATKWQTIRRAVIPAAAPRILTGIILGTGRAFGETAVVLFTAGVSINLPVLLTDPGRTMTSHLYILATEGISLPTAYGTALLLIAIVLAFNYLARKLATKVR